MKDLLVIGGASLDTLHFAGQTASSGGGSGMYTASAAHRSGGQVAIFAPRPDPIPELLQPFANRVDWFGPLVSPEQLPRFEIAHQDGQTTYLNFFMGAEANHSPAALPPDLSGYRHIHIAPLGESQRQLQFLLACRERGARRISVSTFARAAHEEAETVRELIEQADLFFMNEDEATHVFGSVAEANTKPGKLLFVTLGERGAKVVQGDFATHVDAPQVNELDVTGAGDTFSGATLMGLIRHNHPVVAARKAIGLAAHMIRFVGPTALWQTASPLEDPRDPRVVLNNDLVERTAQLVANLPEIQPVDYTDDNFLTVGHPATLDFLFAATLQQFSFWEERAGRYDRPLIAPIAGEMRKGSEYLWQSYLRKLNDDPSWYSPERQAQLTQEEMLSVFRADNGTDPMPALDLHLAQARAYGQDMMTLGLTTASLVEEANNSGTPLYTFLERLDHIGGYKEDPLRKKSALLATILAERPEKFLHPAPEEITPPIIDYHNQRACLRIGLIDVLDPTLYQALAERRVISPTDEQAVREAAYDAMHLVSMQSGKSIAAVDWYFFNARRYCPEMTEPECHRCQMDPICAHRKELFQPVLRTTFY